MGTTLEAGVVLAGRYRLDRAIGEGGMGVVWAATHVVTQRPVALKLLKNLGAVRPEVRRRLVREARAAGLVRHPNVVAVHDVLELEQGEPVLVMDLLEGRTLGQRLAERGRLPLGETAAILVEVGAALGAAHRAGVVHRDLKPDNIFLLDGEAGERADAATARPRVRVLDFGIAKLARGAADLEGTGDLTRTGDMLGTPHYMSPEQAFGEQDLDHRTDLWALGVILHQCLAGSRPFAGDNAGQVLKAILTGEPPRLEDAVPGTPGEVAELVRILLSKAREKRPRDVRIVIDILVRYVDEGAAPGGERPEVRVVPAGTVIASVREEPAGGRRGRAVVVGGLLALLVAAGVAIAVRSLAQPGAPSEKSEVRQPGRATPPPATTAVAAPTPPPAPAPAPPAEAPAARRSEPARPAASRKSARRPAPTAGSAPPPASPSPAVDPGLAPGPGPGPGIDDTRARAAPRDASKLPGGVVEKPPF